MRETVALTMSSRAAAEQMLRRKLEDELQEAVGARRRPESSAGSILAQAVYEAALSRLEEQTRDAKAEQSSAARAIVTLRITEVAPASVPTAHISLELQTRDAC